MLSREAPTLTLTALRSSLEATWRDLLPAGSRCALTLYPDHWNAGDAAIWWATKRLLDEIDVTVAYGCDPWSYDPGGLRAALPEGPILILGGGNFGDVYPREHALRTRILADFPERRIIQLPQSIMFRSSAAVAETADRIARQRDFTLLVRDAASLASAREKFPAVSAQLCPDTALALDLSPVAAAPDVPVLALWRGDGESRGSLPPLPAGWVARDWIAPGGMLPTDEFRELSTAGRCFKEWVGLRPPPAPQDGGEPCPVRRRMAWRHMPWLWDQLAEDRTLRGLRILSRGRVVITNRLHAHLLCLLAGIPHVVCDTANGKIFAHRDTWFPTWADRPPADHRVRFATSPEEAIDLAATLRAA